MADRVEIDFDRAARELLPHGAVVLAAVSGGGDSVALLLLLARIAKRLALRIVVAHLDHALRRGSASDRRFVKRLAAELGLEFISERRPVPTLRRKDESPEEAARRVRRAFLTEAAKRCGASVVTLGHTLDDQAETVLMRICRGAGPSALAGMSASGPGPFVRPLLGFERDELRAYLRRKGVRHIEDASNADPRFPRNRVRREVLPLLVEAVNRRAARHLVEAAERLKEDAALLDRLATSELSEHHAARTKRVTLDAARLAELEPPLARRVVREALARAGVDPRRISSRHVGVVLGLARAKETGGSVDLPGLVALRRGSGVALRPARLSGATATRRRPADR